MDIIVPLAAGLIGLIIGLAAILVVTNLGRREARDVARELLNQAQSERVEDINRIIERLRESLAALSYDALTKNTDEFKKFADATLKIQSETGAKELDEKKKLIDQGLLAMSERLKEVGVLIKDLEKDREQKFGELTTQLRTTAEETSKLRETADHLKTALVSSKQRGVWGERMAEDILRLAGFIEGVNYQKQKSLDTQARPDYTFFLPNDLKVNMDVKFPLDNYLRYLEANSETERNQFRSQFLKDVKDRIKEVTTRGYIDPASKTVDYVLVFIPNEQLYGFIHEADRSILDEALRRKVILCSPLTLYAVLAVIRQAVENFKMERTAAQVLNLLGVFYKQWQTFLGVLIDMGKKIDDAQKQYQQLTTTRKNQLERPLREIEQLRTQRAEIPLPTIDVEDKCLREEVGFRD